MTVAHSSEGEGSPTLNVSQTGHFGERPRGGLVKSQLVPYRISTLIGIYGNPACCGCWALVQLGRGLSGLSWRPDKVPCCGGREGARRGGGGGGGACGGGGGRERV